MKKILAVTLVACLGVAAWAGPVQGQDDDDDQYHPFELNVHVGSMELDLSDRNQFMAGGRALFSLPNGLGVGGNIDWVNTDFASVYLYSAEANWTIQTGIPAALIVSAGVGAISISPEDVDPEDEGEVEPVEDQTSTMVPLGLGVRWNDSSQAAPFIGYRLDLRDNVVFNNEEFDNNHHNWELSGGVSLLF